MSEERIDWMPIAAWSTSVVVQAGYAMFQWLRYRRSPAYQQQLQRQRRLRERKRQLVASKWYKMKRGKIVRGYRKWMKLARCCRRRDEKNHWIVQPRFRSNDESMSVLVVIERPSPSPGCSLVILRRYSMLDSKIYVDIGRVNYEERSTTNAWLKVCGLEFCNLLDDRTVALAFQNHSLFLVRLVLIDIQQRSQWYVELSAPFEINSSIVSVWRGGENGARLRAIYVCFNVPYKFMLIDYVLTRSADDPTRLIASELSNQSITIPGNRVFQDHFSGLRLPYTRFLMGQAGTTSSLVITFDDRGDIRSQPLVKWLRELKSSEYGRRVRSAHNDFRAMVPAARRPRTELHVVNGYMIGMLNHVFAQRPLFVPSLKRRSAEVICRAKPNADFSMLQTEIGFDIFDGIYSDREKPVPTMFLPMIM